MVEWYELVAVVVSFLIGMIGANSYYKKFKNTLKEVKDVVDSLGEVFETLDNALKDDNISADEVRMIYAKIKKLYEELNDLLS